MTVLRSQSDRNVYARTRLTEDGMAWTVDQAGVLVSMATADRDAANDRVKELEADLSKVTSTMYAMRTDLIHWLLYIKRLARCLPTAHPLLPSKHGIRTTMFLVGGDPHEVVVTEETPLFLANGEHFVELEKDRDEWKAIAKALEVENARLLAKVARLISFRDGGW